MPSPGSSQLTSGVFAKWLGFMTALSLTAILAACSEDTSIRQYRVAKKDSLRSAAAVSTMAQSKTQLMLGAIVPNGESSWIFKMMGDPDAVAKTDEQFRNIIKSVEFDASGTPSWKLSEGWQQQTTPDGITYSKLTQSEAGLTATVSHFPFMGELNEDSWRDWVERNINRWRGQLSLQTQGWEEISKELEEFPELTQGAAKAYFVSLTGTGSGSMAPFANQLTSAAEQPAPADNPPQPQQKETPAETPQKSLTYQTPEGWSELAATDMRRAAFSVSVDDQSGEVTAISAGGSISDNIGMWIGQVGLESDPQTKAKILEAADEVRVNELVAKLFTIVGKAAAEATPDGPPATAILVAEIPWRTGESLFVKFKGDASLVESQRQKFVDFLKSIKW